jgi:hypothetical protein
MSIDNISVSLRAWGGDDHEAAAALLDTLPIAHSDGVHKAEGPGVPRVQLLSLSIEDFIGQEEPSEAFAAALRTGLLNAARWMEKQSPEVFTSLRAEGANADVFIGAWIDSDQIDLVLPPEFLVECARHGLPITLITND